MMPFESWCFSMKLFLFYSFWNVDLGWLDEVKIFSLFLQVSLKKQWNFETPHLPPKLFQKFSFVISKAFSNNHIA
jgi:hypothetical protein